MTDIEFQKLTTDEKLKYAEKHPEEVIYELTEKGYEYAKYLEEKMNKKPLGYLGGDIMTHGSNLARQEEYDKFNAAGIPGEVYSPVQNKSINDKSNMTEEENNHLAEKIVEADVERLWNSDFTVLCPEQSAIGTMCEMGILYGWKYMIEHIANEAKEMFWNKYPDKHLDNFNNMTQEEKAYMYDCFYEIMNKQWQKKNYAHYFDIRTNHLNEKDWRRSFSINQFLYGVILAAPADGTLHNSFDEILPILQKEFGTENKDEYTSDWR